MSYAWIRVIVVAVSLFAPSFAQQESSLRETYEISQGVAAYKSAQFVDAIAHFDNAVRLAPDSKIARFYLANSLAAQYIPGVDTPENVKMATDAIEQYSQLLTRQAYSSIALQGIAHLYLQLKKFEEAREHYRQAMVIDPKDSDLYYAVAVTDWAEVYQALAEQRGRMNFATSQTLIFDPVCRDLRSKNLPLVEEGMTMLTKAISLRQDYDDAMAYMNLLYRSRADLECSDPQARADDVRKANDWVDLAMDARKKKAQDAQEKSAPQSGLVLSR